MIPDNAVMAYIEENGAIRILLQFGFCVAYSPLRPRSLAYYEIARRDYLMPRLEAMDWVMYNLVLNEEQMERSVKDDFMVMMNRAWGNEDDEWLARYR